MHYKKYTPYLFISPMILGLFLFRIGPIVAAFFMSFTRWNIRTDPVFLGVGNYVELLNSATFWQVLGNTLIFALIYVPSVLVLALVLAVLINQKLRGIAFFRGLFFMPYITSMVAVAMVWNWIFSTRFGLLNNLLRNVFGATDVPAWLADSNTALLVLIIVTVWKTSGFQMMVFLAGLQGIPSSLYEAARIDGAGRWQIFRWVTLPLISPVTFFVLILSIIEAFRTFEVTFAMTKGGPLNASTTLSYYIYQNAFIYNRMGFASSLAYVLMALVGAITLVNFRMRRRWVSQGVN
ncbi:MAG: sugar ABC transporter permease [Anaerolineae bacterium]|nr:sugar ABC transporter permease [Anaerolineae bacterium]